MRKRLPAFLAATLLLLSACGGGEKSDPLPPYRPSDAGALVDAGVFSGEMEEVDAYVVAMLYGIDEGSIKECACCMALDTSVSADEVTVLVLADEDAAKAAEAGCGKRVQDLMEQCRDYCPDQVPKLEAATVLRRDNTVLFAVADPDALTKALVELKLS